MRKTVEETLGAPLDEKAPELVGAERHERTAGRDAYHSGRYARKLITGAGEVDLSVPKLSGAAARSIRNVFAETLAYTEFPPVHWRRIRTNNGIERINREIGRRTRVVRTYPDGNSAPMLVTGRLKHTVGQEEIPAYVEAGGDGRVEGKDGGLEKDGAEAG